MTGPDRAWLALLCALALSVLLMPAAAMAGKRFGLVSRPRLFGRSEITIPNTGGLAVAIAASVAFTLVWGAPTGLVALLIGTVCIIGLGLADDKSWRLVNSPVHRLLLQIGIATLAWLAGLRADSGGLVGLVGTVLFLVAVMNAFNLLDNMDGVAGSTAAASAAGIAVVALVGGQYTVASLATAVCGAALGFLPFNLHKARLYLGNGGSLLVGFLLGVAALKLRAPLEFPWGLVAMVAILGVPVTDTAVIMISRFMHSRPVMQGGCDHLSHRLVKVGFSTKESALLHGAAALLGGGSVAIGALQAWPQMIALTILGLGAAGLMLLTVPVYEDATLSSRRRILVGAAVMLMVLLLTTATPALAAFAK